MADERKYFLTWLNDLDVWHEQSPLIMGYNRLMRFGLLLRFLFTPLLWLHYKVIVHLEHRVNDHRPPFHHTEVVPREPRSQISVRYDLEL
jgi:hypothetical protein